MNISAEEFDRDVQAVQSISQIPTILNICRQVSGLRYAVVARVTADRWMNCASSDKMEFGLLPGEELDVSTTLCEQVRSEGQMITINDVMHDAVYRTHQTPAIYGFRSYISVPINRKDGSFFGTLCAIDTEPKDVDTEEVVSTFRMFSEMISDQLDIVDELQHQQDALMTARDTARLREEFIAIVGHDLRNPLASLSAGLRMISQPEHEDDTRLLLTEMNRSVERMTSIVANLLDFARGRLGAGISAQIEHDADLRQVIETVVAEVEAAEGRDISHQIDLPDRVPCDPQRMGQLVSNLLANAFTHGKKDHPVKLSAKVERGQLKITVANKGTPIAASVLPYLFQPFYRRTSAPQETGLGLGLYIASEIAKSHRGRLRASSNTERTEFTLTMPIG